jgi:hypothetical protein
LTLFNIERDVKWDFGQNLGVFESLSKISITSSSKIELKKSSKS